MSYSQSISIYSQIFNSQLTKDDKFFVALYTVPVHTDALLSQMQANCQSIGSSVISTSNFNVLQVMFVHGVRLLSDAMCCPEEEVESAIIQDPKDPLGSKRDSESILSGVSTRPESIRSEFDQGGEDITSLSGKALNSSNLHFLTEYSEGDDITTLKGKDSSRRGSNISISSNQKTSLPKISSQSISLSSERNTFEHIDEDLRIEVICNILKTIAVWFKNINATNKASRKSKNSLGVLQDVDLLSTLFQLANSNSSFCLDETYLHRLLKICAWYLNYAIAYVEQNPGLPEYKNLGIVKEIIFLLSDIMKTIFASLLYHNDSTMELAITESLLFTFFKVDFSKVLDKLMTITTPKLMESELQNEPHYTLPDISLSSETLMKLYNFIGALINVPSRYLPVPPTSFSDDITIMNKESLNIYEHYFCNSKEFNSVTFNQEINLRFLPNYAIDFNLYYNLKPDLLMNHIKSGSFMNWITGNRFNDNFYLNYDTCAYVTNLSTNYDFFNLAETSEKYSFIDELQSIEKLRSSQLSQNNSDDDDYVIDIYELLPMSLMLFSYIQNPSFLEHFTNQIHRIDHKIEDITPSDNTYVEIYEIWLCVLSYTFQYQHKSIPLQANTQISLLILLELTSLHKTINNKEDSPLVVENLKNYQINEFKWKLCHQRLPIVPTNIGKEGFKSSLFYILDTLQIFIRFNLTKRINLFNFKLVNGIIYQIVQEFNNSQPETLAIDSYPWNEFFKSLTNLLLFIKKHDLVATKHITDLGNVNKLKSLVEEIFIIIDLLLNEKFGNIIQMTNDVQSSGSHILKSINYELLYIILLNYHSVESLMRDFSLENANHLPNLRNCMSFLDSKFHLTEESKQKEENKSKIDLIDIDYDSPVLIKELSDYAKYPTNEPVDSEITYKYKDTFKFINASDVMSDSQKLKIFNIAFEVY
ncbi:uncharacterized protein AC631_04654 [Debaryomyces fabryi]|uniref:Armadillo-like helical domain-containing protein n=1 Tax=Debaryomyces fabryi TaxID=58627 RepID=A0A0V1PTM2_9ASCO|nr:uncharacterized protein AC631_04654 [Debaryomyces fabryi]KRZ99581.1 hypothetical protein AC631_04654 [Debaryomyces fabryi]CUM54661.1 unnamed protein product [Debaryomyces fabryi]